MARLLRQAALLGIALPTTMLAYHLLACRGAGEGSAEAATQGLVDAVGSFSITGAHSLGELSLFERDLDHVERRYVERDRLDPDQMFQAALMEVEREVPEVMFLRQPAGRRLQISVGAFSTTLLLGEVDSFDAMYTELRRVAEVLDAHLTPEVDRAQVEYDLINGALSTLDPHTLLMNPTEAREMDLDNQGEFGGLGIEIVTEDGRLVIKRPLPDSPATRVGLKSDDRIVRIEGESTLNMDLEEAVEKLRGEVGSPVTIWVERKGEGKQASSTRAYTIIREVIALNPVHGELLEGNIGYVRVDQFHAKVSEGLGDTLSYLRREARENGSELSGLILDLRSNPGGYLNQAVKVSDRFLSEGVIVSTVEGGVNRREVTRATVEEDEPDYPMVVLVNGSSASASEIVAGALRNQDRAVIVGERTFGKGSVQHLFSNSDESKLKLTVAQYLTPGDHSIQSVAIPPDILLRPSVVQPDEGHPPLVSLYWREWVDREADLDRHLDFDASELEEPAFQVRYLRAAEDGAEEEEDLRADWEVGFAREVLLAASGPRRADVLRSAAAVVARHTVEEEEAIQQGFSALGINWEGGENPPDPRLDLEVILDGGGEVVAGQTARMTIKMTNQGDQPLYRLGAVTRSENLALQHREFYFGRIDPGEVKTYTVEVQAPTGYGDQVAPVTVEVRDPEHDHLAAIEAPIRTRGVALPRFTYDVSLVDDGSLGTKGNGDGAPQTGETIAMRVTVHNEGDGPSGEAWARLKNRSGAALDLDLGRSAIGIPRTASGAACDPSTTADCRATLAPGEEAQAVLLFELLDPGQAGRWELALQVGDNEAYDYSAVRRAGFRDTAQLSQILLLQPDQPLELHDQAAPSILVSRAPEGVVEGQDQVLSGLVRDPDGIRDVMVFLGEEKVFFRGGDAETTALPFSVDLHLEPGNNLVVLLARDQRGLRSTWSLDVRADAPLASAGLP